MKAILLFTLSIIFYSCSSTIEQKEKGNKTENDIVEKPDSIKKETILVDFDDSYKRIEFSYQNSNGSLFSKLKIDHSGFSFFEGKMLWDTSMHKINFIKDSLFLSSITPILKSEFKYSNNYFEERDNELIIKITSQTDIVQDFIFRGCYSSGLKSLIKSINEKVPQQYQLKRGRVLIKDSLLTPGINMHWSDYKNLATSNTSTSFKIDEFNTNQLIRIDSSQLAKHIRSTYGLKSTYLIAIKKNIDNYYPCLIFGQQYDSDDITNFLALFMVDSTFNNKGDFEFISSEGCDIGTCWSSQVTFQSDTSFIVKSTEERDCMDEMEEPIFNGAKEISKSHSYSLTREGKITHIKTDTIGIIKCMQQGI